jgi:hypothetical protein
MGRGGADSDSEDDVPLGARVTATADKLTDASPEGKKAPARRASAARKPVVDASDSDEPEAEDASEEEEDDEDASEEEAPKKKKAKKAAAKPGASSSLDSLCFRAVYASCVSVGDGG